MRSSEVVLYDCRTIATRTIPIHNSPPFLLDKNKENQSRYLCYRIKMGGNCGWELSGWQLSGPQRLDLLIKISGLTSIQTVACKKCYI